LGFPKKVGLPANSVFQHITACYPERKIFKTSYNLAITT
jgi:hypothetical protein